MPLSGADGWHKWLIGLLSAMLLFFSAYIWGEVTKIPIIETNYKFIMDNIIEMKRTMQDIRDEQIRVRIALEKQNLIDEQRRRNDFRSK